jgi:hypothetical protein
MEEEIWKPIPEYEDSYEVSNLGRIKSIKFNKEKILKLSFDNYGYNHLSLRKNKIGKTKKVHRLVMLTFKNDSYFDGAQVNHINGIKTDNRLDNLEWCDQFHNMQHAFKLGLQISLKGENHGAAKLNQNQVNKIRFYYENKIFNQRQLANMFNIKRGTISDITTKKIWSHC